MSETAQKPAGSEPPAAKRGWGKILLTLSLALNLLFIGAIIGSGWMRHKYGAHHEGPPDFVVKRMLRSLPENKQKALMGLLADYRIARRADLKIVRSHRSDLKKVWRKRPFNAENVREVARNLQLVRQKLGDAKTELFISSLQQLTPDEREKLLNSRFFRRILSPKKGRWRRPH